MIACIISLVGDKHIFKSCKNIYKEAKMNSWMCEKCGYNMEADAPPEKCPSCSADCSFVDNSCYTPDCAGKPNDPQIKRQS